MICAPPPEPFACVICGAAQMLSPWDRWRGPDTPIPPLCMRCEKDWGKTIGGWGDRNRDRRLMRHVSALAEVISATAYCKINGLSVPYAPA
jgi:hypothetical protein